MNITFKLKSVLPTQAGKSFKAVPCPQTHTCFSSLFCFHFTTRLTLRKQNHGMSRRLIFLPFPMSQTPTHHVKNYGRDASCDCICFHQNKQMYSVKQTKDRPCHCRFQLPRKLLAQVHQAVHTQQLWCTSCAVYNYRQVCTTDRMVMKLMGKNQLLKFIFSLLAKILSLSMRNQGSV